MKYYVIAGEASGDLHASHLIAALKQEDPEAQFRGFGGDLMAAEGTTLVRHYRELAYMGFVAVALHARTILRGLQQCKDDIVAWHPDVVILVDYPGFNLKIAKFVHSIALCPVYYYIAPKLWAWKEYRIKSLRRDVDELFSILPFEVDFFEGKHGLPVHYVGNPTVDEVEAWKRRKDEESLEMKNEEYKLAANPDGYPLSSSFTRSPSYPLIALLAGSRKQEIRDNLPRMIAAAQPFTDKYALVIAGAPGIEPDYYNKYIGTHKVEIVYGKTYELLSKATAALVTSGTATLETALFRVPQVVCYFMKAGWLASLGRKLFIKTPFISLVNLVAGYEVVPELVADQMSVDSCRHYLESILPGGTAREAQLKGYELTAQRLGQPGAPQRAAKLMVEKLAH
ncbi:MAG: lipid-A-disaccharide synthase [Bacteroidaceae bacterium]|nr:lipid-A-disaccharide synthase [Bacteroidaceae bacterium]